MSHSGATGRFPKLKLIITIAFGLLLASTTIHSLHYASGHVTVKSGQGGAWQQALAIDTTYFPAPVASTFSTSLNFPGDQIPTCGPPALPTRKQVVQIFDRPPPLT